MSLQSIEEAKEVVNDLILLRDKSTAGTKIVPPKLLQNVVRGTKLEKDHVFACASTLESSCNEMTKANALYKDGRLYIILSIPYTSR